MDEAILEDHAANQLHIDIFPGTDVMRDVDDIHFPWAHESRSVGLHPLTSLGYQYYSQCL